VRLRSILLLLMLQTSWLFGQPSEEQTVLIETADESFEQGDFVKAMPLYSQLLSIYPSDANYSYKYGACLVENNREIDKSIKYLSYASKKITDDPRVFFYLGKAYHLSYQFDKAIEQLQVFHSKASGSSAKDFQSEQELTQCKNGLDLVKYSSPLMVVENKRIKAANFYYSYKLDSMGGKLVAKPEQFKTKNDIKQNAQDIIFISDTGLVLYSSYGDRGQQRDLFWSLKKADGTFSPAQNMGPVLNTPFDENYPFLKKDGKTLYFSSKGHNTMGGYDIFRSQYDSTAKAWSKPENLDFPTNTPYDDILYVVDADDNLAYFASDRESQTEKLNVYKIQVDKNPVERPINSIEELLQLAKLEVTPLADLKTEPDTATKAVATTQVATFEAQKPKTEFSFDEVYAKHINSSAAYTEQLRADITYLKKDLKASKQKSSTVKQRTQKTIEAYQKKNQARIKLKASLAESKQENNAELLALDEELLALENELSFNAFLLDQYQTETQTREREIEITNLLLNDSSNNNIDELVQNINSNRKNIYKNNQSYVSLVNLKIQKEAEKQTLDQETETARLQFEQKNNLVQQNQQKYQSVKKKIETEVKPELSVVNQKELQTAASQLETSANEAKNAHLNWMTQQSESQKLAQEIQILRTLADLEKNPTASGISTEIDSKVLLAQIEPISNQSDDLMKQINETKGQMYYQQQTEVITAQTDLLAQNNTTEEPSKQIASPESPENQTSKPNANEGNNDAQANSENLSETQANSIANNNLAPANSQIEQLPIFTSPASQIALTQVVSLAARKLIQQSQKQHIVADSLSALASEKEKRLAFLPSVEQQEISKNEIAELKTLSGIQAIKSSDNMLKAQEAEKKYLSEHPEDLQLEVIYNQQVYSKSGNPTETAEQVEYQKSALTSYFIQQQLEEVKLTKTIAEQAIESSESNEEELEFWKEKQVKLSEKETELSQLLSVSERKKDQSKNVLLSKNQNIEAIDEQLFLSSTQVELPQNIQLSASQKKRLNQVENQRTESQDLMVEYQTLSEQMAVLQDSINQSTDVQKTSEWTSQLEAIQEDAWDVFAKADELKQFAHIGEENTLNQILNSQKSAGSYEEAQKFENESRRLSERAALLRSEYKKPEKYNGNMVKLLEKAESYEQMSINKQRAAIDSYSRMPVSTPVLADHKTETTTDAAQNKPDNTSPTSEQANDSDIKVADVKVQNETALKTELLPAEAEHMAQYNRLYAHAESKRIKVDELKTDLLLQETRTERTYDAKDKVKMQQKTNEINKKYKTEVLAAYQSEHEANEIKYRLYDQKVSQAITRTASSERKAIAEQYQMDAAFYKAEAAKEKVDTTANRFDLVHQQNTRLALETEAIKAQELAYLALTSDEDPEFMTEGNLVIVDPLDNEEVPVIDTNMRRKVQTQRILKKLKLSPSDIKMLEKTNELSDVYQKLEKEYELSSAKAKILSDSLPKVKDPKEWEKLDKQVTELETKSLTYLMNMAEISEPINYDRFQVYKNHLNAVRLNEMTAKGTAGRTLEKEAGKTFRRAQNLRTRAFETTKVDRARQMLNEAQALEKQALCQMEEAYVVYLDLEPLDQVVLQHIATNTDTNIVDEHGYTLRPSDGQIEAYQTPEFVEPDSNALAQAVIDTIPANTEAIVDQNEDPIAATETKTEITAQNETVEPVENVVIPDHSTNNEITVPIKAELEPTKTETPIASVDSNKLERISTNENIESPTVLSTVATSGFVVSQAQAYSSTTPIPMNTTLPDGIVYRIQVGAFTRPIPNETFRGLNPVSGETREGSKYIRYYVGVFDTYEAASVALPPVKNLGYRDAFIVAYRNGERVAVYLARQEDAKQTNYTELANVERSNVEKVIQTNATFWKPLTSASSTNITADLTPPPAGSQELGTTQTTMYTIQIGVYRNHVSPQRLYNLSPLFFDKTASGLIRYTAEQFVDFNAAAKRRDEIRALGIKDAFVTAYRNGQRISINQAKEALAGVNEAKTNTAPASSGQTPTVQNTTEPMVTPKVIAVNFDTSQVSYAVQVGAYSKTVPVEVVSTLVQISGMAQVRQLVHTDGRTIYYTGVSQSLKEASALKQQMIQKGLTDAFVIAIDGKKKITLEEAKPYLQP